MLVQKTNLKMDAWFIEHPGPTTKHFERLFLSFNKLYKITVLLVQMLSVKTNSNFGDKFNNYLVDMLTLWMVKLKVAKSL